jgi:Flp pilus assembly protein TadD
MSIRLQPKNAAALDSRGLLNLKQQRLQDAWNDYNAAVILGPSVASFLYGRGIASLRLGRIAEGKADIAQAEKLDANIARTYTANGITP